MKRMMLAAGVLLILATLGHGVGQWSAPEHTGGAVAATAFARPDFHFPDLQGRDRHVREWDGKVLVVNFWATWCGPCRAEMPGFVQLQAKYQGQGVQFVGVAFDDQESIAVFLKQTHMKINYPLLVAEEAAMRVAARYGNTEEGLPFTAVVDRKGHVVYTRPAAIGAAQLEQVIRPLL